MTNTFEVGQTVKITFQGAGEHAEIVEIKGEKFTVELQLAAGPKRLTRKAAQMVTV